MSPQKLPPKLIHFKFLGQIGKESPKTMRQINKQRVKEGKHTLITILFTKLKIPE
jgi:hypothetical protein